MTTTDPATSEDAGGLAIVDGQTSFNKTQVATLRHMGVENAPEEDLRVFFHVCQRTGLDPFARQIHMIGRNAKVRDSSGRERWTTKYTIQTGIDGFRLIGRREANRRHETISVPPHEWMHQDGTWRPVWSKQWGTPLAAKATVVREGQSFTAVAMFDEYAQTKSGGLTSMWAQRPAGQLAKCAEALAWRMAFPQDLAGMYTDDEMSHADGHAPGEQGEAPRSATAKARQRMVEAQAATPEPAADDEIIDAEMIEEQPADTGEQISPAQQRALFAAFRDAGFTSDARSEEGRTARLAYLSSVVGQDVESTSELTRDQASRCIDALRADATDLATTEGDTP